MEYYYAECRYAERHYAECRGASGWNYKMLGLNKLFEFYFICYFLRSSPHGLLDGKTTKDIISNSCYSL